MRSDITHPVYKSHICVINLINFDWKNFVFVLHDKYKSLITRITHFSHACCILAYTFRQTVVFFCFLCLLIMLYEVVPFIDPSNNDNEETGEPVNEVKSILGSEFEDYIGSFSSINTLIEIELGTRFYSMEIAAHFIEQYALQNNFAIFKHKSEKFPDNTYRKRVFKCDMGGRYVRLTRLIL